MKTRMLLLFACALAPLFAKAQPIDEATVQCRYKLLSMKDTLRPDNLTEDILLLNIGRKVSKFYSYYALVADSVKENMKKEYLVTGSITARPTPGKIGEKYNLFKNYPSGKLTLTEPIGADYYKYSEPLALQQWELLPDTTVVLGYPCQKAACNFRGRQYEAWFTSEIPVSDGPWKFSGLPGLILKVYDSQKQFQFECIGIKNLSTPEPIIFDNKNYVEVTKKEFDKVQKRYLANPLEFLKGSFGDVKIVSVNGKEPGQMPAKKVNLIERNE